MKILHSILIILFVFGIISCKKEEGFGGTATISGKVWVQDYNAELTNIKEEFWAQEEDVYLIYGNDTIYSDKTSTNYDGSYWFQYLREGDYTVFVYSDSLSLTTSVRIPIKMKVSIGKSESDVVVPTITIVK